MTYPMWKRWQLWMEQNRTVNEAAEDPDSRYHRMAVAQKMSRKRLRGLIMAAGVSARDADDYLTRMNAKGYSYLDCWKLNKHSMMIRIKNRYEWSAELRLLAAVFGENPPEPDPQKAAAWLKSEEDKKRKSYEADKALIEAHPEITSSREAHNAKVMYIITRSVQKPDGTKVLESGEFDLNKVREFSRLSLWYSFTEWYIRNYGVPN